MILTQNNTALFSGELSLEMHNLEKPRAQYTGYVNITSIKQYYSFNREFQFNFHDWTHFLFKIKGDGRAYSIILYTPGFFSINNKTFYTYPLFTRGGPYWQYAKIPFSKFAMASQGRFSDKQERFTDFSVTNIGITLMDNTEGPFSLEIDYIGLVKDNSAYEEFSYETYTVPKYIANV